MNSCENNYPRRSYYAPTQASMARMASAENGPSLAMAYIPNQTWTDLYDLCVGFQKGTVFQSLDLPFYGSKFRCGNCNCNRR